MSRKIDLSTPLSDEDRQYLVDRDRWQDLANADGHGDPEQSKREAIQGFRTAQEHSVPEPTRVGAEAKLAAAEQNPAHQPSSGDEDEDYEDWTFEDLKAELDERKADAVANGMTQEDANKRYSKGGSQKDLVQRLRDDDAAPENG